MEPFSLAWAAQCMGGQIVGTADSTATDEITSVCIDSRQAKPGALFFALKGEKSDGHEYVTQALRAGAAAAVVEREIQGLKEGKGAQVVVPATLRALGDLARHYRQQFAIPIIGVTGSVGKTSTKEMIAAVLRTTYNTLANEKNYNNEIGVPLTLFNLNKTHEVAVVEMGMRGLGQIDYLAEIAEPTIGVITNIGYSHIELLGSQENIAHAKAELFARLPENGIAILSQQLTWWPVIRDAIRANCRKILFTTISIGPGPDVRVDHRKIQIHADGTVSFRVRVGPTTKSIPVKLHAVGLPRKARSLPFPMTSARHIGHCRLPSPSAVHFKSATRSRRLEPALNSALTATPLRADWQACRPCRVALRPCRILVVSALSWITRTRPMAWKMSCVLPVNCIPRACCACSAAAATVTAPSVRLWADWQEPLPMSPLSPLIIHVTRNPRRLSTKF